MKRLFGAALRLPVNFVRIYKLLAFALTALITAGILQAIHAAMAVNWVLGIASGIALIPIVISIVRDIQSGRYGVDILAFLAIATSLVLQQYWAAIVIVIMLAGGKSLEDFASHRARSELRDLLKHEPVRAHVVYKGKETDVAASTVREGDTIVIRPGEIVPVDAVIIEGASTFDESSLTGESLPIAKDLRDAILSGSVNGEGVITAQATHTAANSQYQQIVRLINAAAEHPAPFVRLADRYSIPFTVLALTIGGVAWILSHEPIRFLEVLVVATPCPLILATPIALIAGMSRAAHDGIIIKTGTALELLAQAKTFAFDKTGTLTYGRPEVDQIVAYKPFAQADVLAWAAALEQQSNHVLATAIRTAASQQSLKLPKTKHIAEVAGRGLQAHAGGKDILIGRLSYLVDQGVSLPATFERQAVAGMATFVAVQGSLAGYITFRDEVRSEAKPTLSFLKKLGAKKFVMVTGDHETTAQTVAKQLGIADVAHDMLPGDKLTYIEHLSERPVVFVGDGVNDAPVLMAADAGIALGARGSTAASESADVVIMKDDLSYVARSVAQAKRAFSIANQSILFGIVASVVLMFVFATGKFSPIAGAVTQEVLDVLVILNALRAHQPGKRMVLKASSANSN